MAGRWGGEEFVIVLQHLKPEHLRDVADKLRVLVENSFLERNGETLNITISMGATMIRPDDSPSSLIERADILLYEAKQQGRNRVFTG